MIQINQLLLPGVKCIAALTETEAGIVWIVGLIDPESIMKVTANWIGNF